MIKIKADDLTLILALGELSFDFESKLYLMVITIKPIIEATNKKLIEASGANDRLIRISANWIKPKQDAKYLSSVLFKLDSNMFN